MNLRIAVLLLLGGVAACGGSQSTVVVMLSAEANVPPVEKIRVSVSNAGATDSLVYGPAGDAAMIVALPTSLAIILPHSRSGTLDLAFDALDPSMNVVANGAAQAGIVVGGTATVSVTLKPGPSACGNGRVDAGEDCDDGNRFSGDGCDLVCHRDVARDAGGEPTDVSDAADTTDAGIGDDATPSEPVGSPVGGTGGSAAGDSGGGAMPPDLAGYTLANIGGYKLGPPAITDMPGVANNEGKTCDVLTAVVRDFKGTCAAAGTCVVEPMGHPDFETFAGDCPTTGLLAPMLGPDHKPVYASMCEAGAMPTGGGGGRGNRDGTCMNPMGPCPFGQMTTSKIHFDEWYRFTDGVNKPFLLYLKVVALNGVATFASDHFFPLDNEGWGNSGKDAQGMPRNFGFTTELHSKIKYDGGETFTFTGDDDVWVFVNDRLALDLGGLHPQATATINLDAQAANLGIAKGMIYPLDLFHAERHTDGSDFRIDTNVELVDCGTVIK